MSIGYEHLSAMPDRVILRFPKSVQQINGIYVPETSSLRPELGEVVSVGDGLSQETKILSQEIKERARRGERFLVPMATGTYYWRKELGDKYAFLEEVRCYRITELAVTIASEETDETNYTLP